MRYIRDGKIIIFDYDDVLEWSSIGLGYILCGFLIEHNAVCSRDGNTLYAGNPSFSRFDDSHHFWSETNDETYSCVGIYTPQKYELDRLTAIKELFLNGNIPDNKINEQHSNKGGNTMENNDVLKTMMSMKMLNSVMKDGDPDIGKLLLMQQLTSGQPLQVTDVIKSKIIDKFSLDKDEDLSIEKILLLQMLDSGKVDINQLLTLKMMTSLLKEEETV